MKDWEEQTEKYRSGQDSWTGQYDWTDYAKPGDLVDESVIDYFMTVLPPRTIEFGMIQVGEPYSSRKNEDTGRFEDTYLTFAPAASAGKGMYRYCGTCFYKQTKNID